MKDMATNFKFRFDKILYWYTEKEDEAKKKLAELKSEYLKEENRLREIEKEKELGEKIFLENINNIGFSLIVRDYIEKKKEEVNNQKNKLRELDERISKQREVLLYWEMKKKSMEKLKERDILMYQLKLKRLENIILDENGIVRYLRKYENT
ncbi:flagellar export protein FliJ [bacterium]|nr:flagellar export protein FliJ [bacterium]